MTARNAIIAASFGAFALVQADLAAGAYVGASAAWRADIAVDPTLRLAQNEDAINYNASKSNTGNRMVTGPGTGHHADKAKTYNSSHSNTGNKAAPATRTGHHAHKAKTYNASHSNTGNRAATGPGAETEHRTDKSINYNSSKSNTGN